MLVAAGLASGPWWLASEEPAESPAAASRSRPDNRESVDRSDTVSHDQETGTQRRTIARHLDAERFEAAVAHYNDIDGDEQHGRRQRGRRRILDKARTLVEAGRHEAAIELLSAFTRINHRDLSALMALARAHRARGDHEAALDILFRAGTAANQAYGRSQIEAVESAIRATVQDRASALTRASDRNGLITLYRTLIQKGYAHPQDRLELALHLKQAGRYRAARDAVAAVRHVPAVADEAAELERRIEQARRSDDTQRQRHRIGLQSHGEHSSVEVAFAGGAPLELIVDTGASLVAVTEAAARRSGLDQRERLGRRSLQTANGVVEAEIVQARRLRVGGLEIRELAVAILPRSLGGVDGLLGMNALRGYDVRLNRDARQLTLTPE